MMLSFSFLFHGLFVGCASENYTRLYHTEKKAPSLPWSELDELQHMGATIIDRGVHFSVYSEHAERIEVLLFDDPESDLPTQQFPLHQRDDLWHIYIEGIGTGQHYGYIAWGPNWEYDENWLIGEIDGFRADVDEYGNRFNPNKLLFDPWTKAIHRDHDWFKGSTASGPQRTQSTYAAGSKSVVHELDYHPSMERPKTYQWSDNESTWIEQRKAGTLAGHGWNELIMYEVHLKGFTMNQASGVEYPGTYRGFGELAPYLKDLGINAVELMPIHEKPLDGGYWGYNNLSFFAPEHSFSADFQSTGRIDGVIDEFKWMVDQLHQHDIEVIIDVVYNHTGEGGLWREKLFFESFEQAEAYNFDPKEVAGLYSYRGLDNISWYALSPDGQTYWNNTGVGNQTRANHTPMKKLIMDSLLFMVDELHVDGFRFDLAGVLGEPDRNYNGWIDPSQTVLQEIIDDPVFQEKNIRMISEPWTAAWISERNLCSGPSIGGFPTSTTKPEYAWAEWNAPFRDFWRDFINNCNYEGCAGMPADGTDYRMSLNHKTYETYHGPLDVNLSADGGSLLTGSAGLYGWNDRKPYHSINFITVHDGFTMYDLVSYFEKQNECGLLNPKCCEDPNSVWCDTESGDSHNRSFNWGSEYQKRQQMRNFFSVMMLAHGTPLMLGGDEWMRTKFGNNNSYTAWADNEWNWFRWGEWQSTTANSKARMHDFVRDLIHFRKDHIYALSPLEHGGGMPFSWRTAGNTEMLGDDWAGRSVMMHYYKDENWDQPELAILINMTANAIDFQLPEGRTWQRIIDTQSYFDTDGSNGEPEGALVGSNDLKASANITLDNPMDVDSSYGVQAWSIVVVKEKQ